MLTNLAQYQRPLLLPGFEVENERDYLLLVFGADSRVAGKHIASFDDYRLQIGVNAPQAIKREVQAATWLQ